MDKEIKIIICGDVPRPLVTIPVVKEFRFQGELFGVHRLHTRGIISKKWWNVSHIGTGVGGGIAEPTREKAVAAFKDKFLKVFTKNKRAAMTKLISYYPPINVLKSPCLECSLVKYDMSRQLFLCSGSKKSPVYRKKPCKQFTKGVQ